MTVAELKEQLEDWCDDVLVVGVTQDDDGKLVPAPFRLLVNGSQVGTKSLFSNSVVLL